jgi:hypothetical protein
MTSKSGLQAGLHVASQPRLGDSRSRLRDASAGAVLTSMQSRSGSLRSCSTAPPSCWLLTTA